MWIWIFAVLGIGAFCFIGMSNLTQKKLFEREKEIRQLILDLTPFYDERFEKMCATYQAYKESVRDLNLNEMYECSSSIVTNAQKNPTKYIIKYSDMEYNEMTLEKLTNCLEFEEVYMLWSNDFWYLYKKVKEMLPVFLRDFVKISMIPVLNIVSNDFIKMGLPQFDFIYTSPGGRSSSRFSIPMDVSMLRCLIEEVESKLTKEEFAKMQRSAMTNSLREAIKKRDNYTCCKCGNSVYNEPNLLLEVDHIIPVAKGGVTEASNLQTLCWKCNRAKSDSI